MNDKKLQQDAFMWFKERYGRTPEELGYKVIATRNRNICFVRNRQVIFAKNQSDNNAFIKEQTIIEKAATYSMLVILITVGLFFLALTSSAINNAKQLMYIAIAIDFLAVVSLIICYNKLKPLAPKSKDVIIYAA